MKYNIITKETGEVHVGSFVRLKMFYKFDHAFVLKVEGRMVYHMSVGLDEITGNMVFGEMAINPTKEIYHIEVELVEYNNLNKPTEPESNDEDDIASWIVDNEEYKDAVAKLQRHICNKEEILYLIHSLKTCNINGKTIEINDLSQLEQSITQIKLI